MSWLDKLIEMAANSYKNAFKRIEIVDLERLGPHTAKITFEIETHDELFMDKVIELIKTVMGVI